MCLLGWLTITPDGSNKAYCKCCKSTLLPHRKDLEVHAKSKKHESCRKADIYISSMPKITNFTKKSIDDNRKVAELKLAAFIAEHCSIKTIDHMTETIKNLDKDSRVLQSINMRRTKCTALILNVLSPCYFSELIEDIGTSFYSLIVDESTTIDTKKCMSVMVRYYSITKKSIVTTFYKLIELEGGDADSMFNAFKKELESDGLKLSNMIGIGIDGANVMIGKKNSFTSRLKLLVPHLVVVKCLCHSLHLAAENACLVLPKQLDFIVRETHNWFSASTKRQQEYKRVYDLIIGGVPKKVSKLSGTRWLARYEALAVILDQWDALKLHFSLAAGKERCYTADQLNQMYDDNQNKIYLTFLLFILKKVTSVNKLFQSDQVNPLQLFDDLHNVLYFLLQQIVVPQQLEKMNHSEIATFDFKEHLMPTSCINFGYQFNLISDKEPNLMLIKERCVFFLIKLTEEIQMRIPDNFAILQKLSNFSPEIASSCIKPDIVEIVKRFKVVCNDQVDDTISEWNTLQNSTVNCCFIEEYWAKVSSLENSCGEKRFGNISKLVLSLLSIPFSNATVERSFSILNIVKDKLRNRMSIKTANAILRVRYSLKNGCPNFQPSEAMLRRFKSEDMYKCDDIDENVMTALSDFTV